MQNHSAYHQRWESENIKYLHCAASPWAPVRTRSCPPTKLWKTPCHAAIRRPRNCQHLWTCQEPGILPHNKSQNVIKCSIFQNAKWVSTPKTIKDSLVMVTYYGDLVPLCATARYLVPLVSPLFHLVEVRPLFQEFLQCFRALQESGHPVLHSQPESTASASLRSVAPTCPTCPTCKEEIGSAVSTFNWGWNSLKSRAYCMECWNWNVQVI